MNHQKKTMLKILKLNNGFDPPDKWIEYGLSNNFKQTSSKKLEKCPDCDGKSFSIIGQFIYYSTLIKLVKCTSCGLIYTDTKIDSNLISEHFENSYKDENYFVNMRSRIFSQIADIAEKEAPESGRVLDIGGAKGHLLATLKVRRPDLDYVLNDISLNACRQAQQNYNLKTITGGLKELSEISSQFDLVILSDVIYYEPNLSELWNVLNQLVSKNGIVIIRIPNKLPLIRLWQLVLRTISPRSKRLMQDKIKFFNPEHLFVLSRHYLSTRLKDIGFQHVSSKPSELLVPGRLNWIYVIFYYISKSISLLSFDKIISTPSLLVIGIKKE